MSDDCSQPDLSQLSPHSTRLFPVGRGARGYQISGIAELCDWVLLSDLTPPYIWLQTNDVPRPRSVFLSLRNPSAAITAFATEVLPDLPCPVILISGSEDYTIPNQRDLRFPAHDEQVRHSIGKILESRKIIHWYAENLDEKFSPKCSGIPLGIVNETEERTLSSLRGFDFLADASRTTRALCAHRVREGPQWDVRRQVSQWCREHLPEHSLVLCHEVPYEAFVDLVRNCPFTICVEGGGLDPSPKAWLAMLYGSIPIIRRSAATECYRDLPVVYVDTWEPGAITPERLLQWRDEYESWHTTLAKRRQLLHMLSVQYWWSKIEEQIQCADVIRLHDPDRAEGPPGGPWGIMNMLTGRFIKGMFSRFGRAG